jgi:hypothetical protein
MNKNNLTFGIVIGTSAFVSLCVIIAGGLYQMQYFKNVGDTFTLESPVNNSEIISNINSLINYIKKNDNYEAIKNIETDTVFNKIIYDLTLNDSYKNILNTYNGLDNLQKLVQTQDNSKIQEKTNEKNTQISILIKQLEEGKLKYKVKKGGKSTKKHKRKTKNLTKKYNN